MVAVVMLMLVMLVVELAVIGDGVGSGVVDPLKMRSGRLR